MRFLSVCSGIEAASVAWEPLGWGAFGFAEIEKFPSQVLAHHYGANLPGEPWSKNGVPNFGDMSKFEEWPDATVDVLVGGTPCQDFSIAGLRAGMDGIRGSLTLVYAAIARRYRPRWLVWENVPGVLSSNSGRDFASLLGLLSGRRIEIPADGWKSAGVIPGIAGAYGLAWRVLDAQFVRVDGFTRAVPQRRRRVFIVGYLGDWRRAAAVLFERAGLSGDSAPRREAGQGFAADTAPCLTSSGRGVARTGETRGQDPINAVSGTIEAAAGRSRGAGASPGILIPSTGDVGTSQAIAFSCKDYGADAVRGVAPTMRAMGFTESHANAGGQLAVAFDLRGRDGGAQLEGPHSTANIRSASGGSSRSYVAEQWAVRRLTPLECERLQGFPDGYTAIPIRDKQAADGPRYKALGNSMAVNVMRWIGQRIQAVSDLT